MKGLEIKTAGMKALEESVPVPHYDERGDIGCHRRDGPEGEKVSEKRYDPSGW